MVVPATGARSRLGLLVPPARDDTGISSVPPGGIGGGGLIVMRLPDFIIIGAMKAGTTTLFRWLGDQPEIRLPAVKEPEFFSDTRKWERGVERYTELFVDAGPEVLTGEASVAYTDTEVSEVAAARMRESVPDARLVYLVRHPVERARSHYQHEVQRGRETRPFREAISGLPNAYVGRSLYARALEPYLERFPAEQVLVVRFEDLISDEAPGWHAVVAHLGLTPRLAPGVAYNVTGDKAQFTPVMRWLWERRWDRGLSRAPRLIRRLGRPLLLRQSSTYRRRLATAGEEPPPRAMAAIWDDADKLQGLMGLPRPLWDRSTRDSD